MSKPTKWPVRPVKTQISLYIRAVQSVFAVHMKKNWSLATLKARREDWADAKADFSLRWAHRPFCWFCHAVVMLSLAASQHYL